MDYLAIFSSVNLVNQLKGRLKRDGRYFGMIRAPHGLSPGGCGFALRFPEEDLLLIRQAVEELKIPLNGIYREAGGENGTKSYFPLE
jgi:hypothetical protein